MKQTTFDKIVKGELQNGAILNEEYQGFKEDYLVLHCLLRKYKPKTLLEVGTNMGTGTNIICNAIPDAKVISLDLPYEMADVSLQSPVSEGKGMNTGSYCKFPFTQVWGDSTKYDYSQHYPIDAWYIDGEHNYDNPFHESKEAIKSGSKLIIWHDSDMETVNNAIKDAFKGNKEYNLFRVIDTRIAYAVKK
jgi:precorrin-6B methylase 2